MRSQLGTARRCIPVLLSCNREAGAEASRMDRFVARENVRRFRQQLENCTDEQQLQTLRELLAETEQQLAELEHRPRPNGGVKAS